MIIIERARERQSYRRRITWFLLGGLGFAGAVAAIVIRSTRGVNVVGVIAIVGASVLAFESSAMLREPTISSSHTGDDRRVHRRPAPRIGRIWSLKVDVDRALDADARYPDRLSPILREVVEFRTGRRFGSERHPGVTGAGSQVSPELSNFLNNERVTDLAELERLVKEVQEL